METKCEACGGEGIVGAGDFPLAKQGVLSTCTVCGGTGKGSEEVAEAAPEEVAPEAPAEESFSPESEEVGETSEGEVAPVE